MKCNDVGSTLGSVLFLSLYRSLFPSSESWLPSTRQVQIQAQPCASTAQSGVTEMKCNSTVLIFTDLKPGDLWTIPALFKQANALGCRPEDYPIKAVFGGGGYNSDMTRNALVRYLLYLQHESIVPRAFDVSTKVYRGPTDLHAGLAKARKWGEDFYHPEIRDDPANHPMQGALESTFSCLEDFRQVISTMAKTPSVSSPIIVGLRPIFEFVVCWSGVFQLENFPGESGSPFKQEYVDRMHALGWDQSQYQSVLNALARHHVLITETFPYTDGLGEFYSELISSDSDRAQLRAKAVAIDTFFRQVPQRTQLVDRHVLLVARQSDSSQDARSDDSNPFTSLKQPRLYREFWDGAQTSKAARTLRELVANHTKKENAFSLQKQEVRLRKLTKNNPYTAQAFGTLKSEANNLAAKEKRRESVTGDEMKHFEDSINSFSLVAGTLMIRSGIATQDINKFKEVLDDWAEVAPFLHTRVDIQDLLLPFLLEPTPNVVKSAMVPFEWVGLTVEGYGKWQQIEGAAVSTAQIWFTYFASNPNEAHGRRRRLQAQLGIKYTGVFDKAGP
ncbi:MAG: hypothetical protein M1838_005916 [Thelocarpon superellum]|nr:MAG: hypothetical protein M1838_005916 [Thelocarpon superellum]